MKEQNGKIKGYRELSQSEINFMNEIKSEGVKLGELIERLENDSQIDQRMVQLAKDNLQVGIMLAVRSVAKPTTF